MCTELVKMNPASDLQFCYKNLFDMFFSSIEYRMCDEMSYLGNDSR